MASSGDLAALSPTLPLSPSGSTWFGHGAAENGRRHSFYKFGPSLKELLERFHHQAGLIIQVEALAYLENRLNQILRYLCGQEPTKIAELEQRLEKLFPPEAKRAQAAYDAVRAFAYDAVRKGKRCLSFPHTDVRNAIHKDYLARDKDFALTIFVCAVLEFVASDDLKWAGELIRNQKRLEICLHDVKQLMAINPCTTAVCETDLTEPRHIAPPKEAPARLTPTYEDIVKDLIADEKAYSRDLSLINKVFRRIFSRLSTRTLITQEEMSSIFFMLDDLMETSNTFLNWLEDCVERSEGQGPNLLVGSAFEEMAEAGEFEGFVEYAVRMLDDMHQNAGADASLHLPAYDAIERVVKRRDAMEAFKMETGEKEFLRAVQYVLPRLLVTPLSRAAFYLECCECLQACHTAGVTSNQDDFDSLYQAASTMTSVVKKIKVKLAVSRNAFKMHLIGQVKFRTRRYKQQMADKVEHILRHIEGLDAKETSQTRLELVHEGSLSKFRSANNTADRYLFLFDNLILLCKPKPHRKTTTSSSPEFILKAKFYPLKTTVTDPERNMVDLMNFGFQLVSDELPNPERVLLCALDMEEKLLWLSSFAYVQTRSILDRMLDRAIEEEEKLNPLRLPLPEFYSFAEPDSSDNIAFEESSPTDGIPLIRGATLYKLIERLTYHQYFDPNFVRTFLITFRSFVPPRQLLDLLIDRFKIPEPAHEVTVVGNGFNASISEQRFKKEYCQPVRFRVLNVLRQWVEHHFLDFENDPQLLDGLRNFLLEYNQPTQLSIRKIILSVTKAIDRKVHNSEPLREPSYTLCYPELEDLAGVDVHLHGGDLMTFHPKEIARQVTLLEFDIYRSIKPSEMVEWNTRKNADGQAPNLERLIRFSNTFIHFLVRYIVSTENFEERVAVVSRVIEIMHECDELNNLNGVMEINSALQFSALHRLQLTFAALRKREKDILAKMEELSVASRHGKAHKERLMSCEPPCIPFIGIYLTQLLHVEEGNPAYLNMNTDTPQSQPLPLHERRLINFNKRRKVADIVAGIQQYQQEQYVLRADDNIRTYLVKLDPYHGLDTNIVKGEKELVDWMYEKSQVIEPRGATSPPKFPKRFRFPLKYKRTPSHLSSRSLSQAASTYSMQSLTSPNGGPKNLTGDDSTPSAPSTPATPNEMPFPGVPPGSSPPGALTLAGQENGLTLTRKYIQHHQLVPSEPAPPVPPRRPLPPVSATPDIKFSPGDGPPDAFVFPSSTISLFCRPCPPAPGLTPSPRSPLPSSLTPNSSEVFTSCFDPPDYLPPPPIPPRKEHSSDSSSPRNRVEDDDKPPPLPPKTLRPPPLNYRKQSY